MATMNVDNQGQNHMEKAAGDNPAITKLDSAKPPASGAGCSGCRMSAKAVLKNRIEHLRAQADKLEALHDSLPEKMPLMADEALWSLVIDCHRR